MSVKTWVITALALAAAGCGKEAEAPAPAPSGPDAIGSPDELLEALDRYRARNGLRSLRRKESLMRAAAGHAEEMGRLGYFSSYSPVPARRTPSDRLALAGWPADRRFFELFGAGSGRQVFGMWTSNPEHAAALQDPAYDAVGVGHVAPGASVRTQGLWVLILGEREF